MPGPACVRHPGRETGVRCTRCDRPACADCLREAPVGYQCVDCVAEGARSRPRSVQWPRPAGRPVVAFSLIAINVVIFAITAAVAGSVENNDASSLFGKLALQRGEVANGAWWELLTSGFLHFGPIHLAFNMIALWVIGRDLERLLGSARFLVLYLVSLLGGSLVVLLFENAASRTAGASGAVFGLMGGLAVVLWKMRLSPSPALTIIAVNVIISFVIPQISWLGHLGGLAFGAATTALMLRRVASP
ncbi:MAG TPA: rhomboid family intramembrane serine protease [Pseudonocardiaceae bacterium]|nr:rhomboid family intramembrane serine protease [Pseudonocardiaceae bacterium]